MPSVIDLCNTALAHLGDEADIQSIVPPDGSAQSVHCARFYPICRDSLLEMHDWNFASRRSVLAEYAPPDGSTQLVNQWLHAYETPAQMICARKVLDVAATDDWSVGVGEQCSIWNNGAYGSGLTAPDGVNSRAGLYTPQPFIVESLDSGASVIYTNQANAQLQYTIRISDPTRFSPLFCEALGYLLASKLAGPILKGQEGRAVAKDMLATAMGFLSQAKTSDAGQRRTDIAPSVSWIDNR